MIVLTSLVVLAAGFWLVFALVGAVLKLVFGIIGGVFSLFATLLGAAIGGLAMLLVAPMVVLALMPVLLPVAALALIIWAVSRAGRRHPDVVVMPASR